MYSASLCRRGKRLGRDAGFGDFVEVKSERVFFHVCLRQLLEVVCSGIVVIGRAAVGDFASEVVIRGWGCRLRRDWKTGNGQSC